jgi:hypothetical protein
MRSVIWIAVIVVAAFLLVTVGKSAGSDPSDESSSGTVTINVSVIPAFRSVTVTPDTVDCTNYAGGKTPNLSRGALGFPNGTCSVGQFGKTYPVKITYGGVQGYVYVQAGTANPSDNGNSWTPCAPKGKESPCQDKHGLPGENQYTIRSFGAGYWHSQVLTGTAVCDFVFRPVGGCYASRGNFQDEGFDLVGPAWPDDTSTSWTVGITWMAMPRSIRDKG